MLRRCDEEGVQLILLSGANPSRQLPLGRVIQRRGDLLSVAVVQRLPIAPDVVRAFNWPDRGAVDSAVLVGGPPAHELAGHHRVAARVLDGAGRWSLADVVVAAVAAADAASRGAAYYREHVGPWVRRRLTGTSSGDGREPKFGRVGDDRASTGSLTRALTA